MSRLNELVGQMHEVSTTLTSLNGNGYQPITELGELIDSWAEALPKIVNEALTLADEEPLKLIECAVANARAFHPDNPK